VTAMSRADRLDSRFVPRLCENSLVSFSPRQFRPCASDSERLFGLELPVGAPAWRAISLFTQPLPIPVLRRSRDRTLKLDIADTRYLDPSLATKCPALELYHACPSWTMTSHSRSHVRPMRPVWARRARSGDEQGQRGEAAATAARAEVGRRSRRRHWPS
jgi:hypothetical protein